MRGRSTLLVDADFTAAKLHGASLRSVEARGANFKHGGNLRPRDHHSSCAPFLLRWQAVGAIFNMADVSQAHVTSSDFSRAEFRQADLTGADFRDSDMTCARN